MDHLTAIPRANSERPRFASAWIESALWADTVDAMLIGGWPMWM